VSYTGGRSTYDGASGSFGARLHLISAGFAYAHDIGLTLIIHYADNLRGVRLFSESFARVYNSGDANDGNPSTMRGVYYLRRVSLM
jgi:hypothetical protein